MTTPDIQRIGDNAASMDDRVYEVVSTPPSLGAKTIMPTSVESASVNPRTLVVPGVTNGTVKLLPCALQVGSPSIALGVALEATLQTALASAAFAANSSGSTRYDLLYATVQRTVDLTAARVFKSTVDGTLSTQVTNIEDAPTVTLTILPNVGNVTPLATMPADNNGGANGEAFGSYNFPLALVALPNGYAGGGAIAQSIITQMWSGGWTQRGRALLPPNWGGATPNEEPSNQLSSRWGGGKKFFIPLKLVSSTPQIGGGTGVILDSSIDWRHRAIWGIASYFGSASQYPLETMTTPVQPSAVTQFGPALSANGSAVTGNPWVFTWAYSGGAPNIDVFVDSSGNLRVLRGTALVDNTNGDAILLVIEASDQFLNGM